MNNVMQMIREKVQKFMEKSRFFSRNTTPKVVSIVFALVMWLYVMGEVNPEDIIEMTNVRVQLLNVEELRQSGLVIIGQKDFTVNVKVKGRRNELYKIAPQDIVVRADLRGFRNGVNSVPLEFSAPANITVEDISPKQIKVTLDEIVKKQKPVVVQSIGSAAQGYEPANAIVTPSEVIVEGPESLVNAVTMVVVDVNLDNRAQDIKDRLPLKAVNRAGKEVNGVEIKNKYVEVTLPIYKIKEVPISIDLNGQPRENFKIIRIVSTPNTVIIKGPKDKVDAVEQIKTKTIEIGGLDKTISQTIDLILPEGIETPYLETKPTVKITVEEVRKKEFSFSKNEITVDNLENGYIIDLKNVPETIKLEVTAVESIIQDIQKKDIRLYLNVNGLLEGKYSAKILYDIPAKIDKVTVIPDKTDFEIKKDDETEKTNGDLSNDGTMKSNE